MTNSEPESTLKSSQVEILPSYEAQRIEGLCKEAETLWTAFLVESKLWEEKPEIIDLVTPEGVFIGKVIKKDSTKIDKKLEGHGRPLQFGAQSYLMITPDAKFQDLENTVFVQKDGKVIARKFGVNWKQNENIFRNKAELASQLSGDERMEEVQLLVDLMKEDMQIPENDIEISLEEIFQDHLKWVKDQENN